jgi:arabinofuranosyltransferase
VLPSSRSSRLLPVIALPLLAALTLYIGWVNLHYAYDDAFITYRVAYNFATGQGFVYNLGERFLGITTPGLALLLGIGGGIVGAEHIPLISGLISTLALGAGGLALYVFGAQHQRGDVGLQAALLYMANPMIAITFGGEMPLQLALILWAIVACIAEWRIACALLLAAATVVRLDALVAVGIIGLYDLARTRRIAWTMWIAFAVAVLPFALLAWWYFGSPLPVTLGAKLAQRDSGAWVTYGRGLRTWMHNWLGPEGRPAAFELFSWDPRAVGFWIVIGLPAVFFAFARCWLLPLAWVAAFVFSYRMLKVPFYHWYAAPAVVGIAILAACGIDVTLRFVWRLFSLRGEALRVTAGVMVCGLVGFHTLRTLPVIAQTAPILEAYQETGQWLAANTALDASVGYYEIGYLGYYAHRRVIDPLGLLHPAIVPHVAMADFTWAYREYKPAYIVMQTAVDWTGVKKADWFDRDYRAIHTVTNPRLPGNSLIIYHRVAP